ncbi:MAG: hypothetical protein JSS20_10890 [Proteobacteria bacterium]|nr:hypothetical protein [Pseudomonadota bacterium]
MARFSVTYAGFVPARLGDAVDREPFAASLGRTEPQIEPFALFLGAGVRSVGGSLLGGGLSGTKAGMRLVHLYVSATHLLVTDAEDLHAPGPMWSAELLETDGSRSVYRLLCDPAPGASRSLHLGAVGRAVLDRSDGRWHLHMEGEAITSGGRIPFAFEAD